MEMKIFLANLGKYNEGELVGKWVSLPCQNITKELETIGVKEGSRYEEYFIPDYEYTFFEIGEYANLKKLNELAKKLQENEKLQEIEEAGEFDWLGGYLEAYGCNIEEAIDEYRDTSKWYPGKSLLDVAEELIHTQFKVPKELKMYIDYEGYARDLSFNGFTEVNGGVIEML